MRCIRRPAASVLFTLFLFVAVGGAGVVRAEEAPRARTFRFTYAASLTGLPAGAKVRLWLPVPPSNEDQDAVLEAKTLPAEARAEKERKYGNALLYLEPTADAAGVVPLEVVWRITRREVRAETGAKPTEEEARQFLKADARVPVGGKTLALLEGKETPADQLKAARLLYDVVDRHMRYSKEGQGWGRGDAEWACQSGFGNCSDFHSLFIALARAKGIPAKFEIGFPLPEKRGQGPIPGYHCWAKFRPEGRGWTAVDVSEANKNPKLRDYYFGNLTENRVAFTTGRDLLLEPRQAGEPLNFFVYPYAEVDGKPWPTEKLKLRCAFEDARP